MNRYESYKDSGVEWLGEIPSHWEFEKIKYSCQIFNGDSLNENQKKLYSSENKSHLPYISSKDVNLNFSTIDYDNGLRIPLGDKFKIAPKNSILLCIEGGSAGRKLAFTNQDVNFVNKLACFKSNRKTCSKFIFYSLKGIIFQSQFFNSMTGLIGGVSISSIENFNLLFPPLSEQQKIAQYLDDKTAKIDQAIMLEEKQIELLKEHKQILIQNAVTKGLNPHVKFKHSGVEWIGEVPEHWEVENSKWIFAYRKEKARKDDEQLTASQKHGVIPQQLFMELEERRVTLVEFNYEILKHVEKGDFVISMRSFQGGIEYCDYTGCVSSAYVALIPSKKVYAPYYKFLLKSSRYIEALQSTSNLVRDGQALRYENFCMVELIVPLLSEQASIAQYLDEQTAKIDHAIQLKQQQIDKLKEYKTVLINDVVTGKVKVA